MPVMTASEPQPKTEDDEEEVVTVKHSPKSESKSGRIQVAPEVEEGKKVSMEEEVDDEEKDR